MRQPAHKRTAAQVEAGQDWAAAGRAAQARRGRRKRSARQIAAGKKFAAAGRAAQARKRNHLKALPKHTRALAGPPGGTLMLPQPVLWPACTATAVANHLYLSAGTAASEAEIIALHLAAGGDEERGAAICDVLEAAAVRGLAGARIGGFWPVAGQDLPGLVAGLRLPRGAHTVLLSGGTGCVSWGDIRPVDGEVEEAWWIEWAG